ncbi:MAG: hypothetical protein KDH09_02390 [Chrysiogenetes bacterium]|nr:hypothetical protein [Chrysiogenetes bacterium]
MNKPANYRYRDLKPGDAYSEAWRRVYQRECAFFSAMFAFVAGAGVGMVIDHFGVPLAAKMLISLAGICVFILALLYQYSPCPRCKRAYNRMWWYGGLVYRSTCARCGLPKWAPDDPEKGEG